MRKTFVVFIAFIMLYVVVDQYDTWMSYNEIKQYYTDNYTFIYKQKTLSKSLTKQFLQQLKDLKIKIWFCINLMILNPMILDKL